MLLLFPRYSHPLPINTTIPSNNNNNKNRISVAKAAWPFNYYHIHLLHPTNIPHLIAKDEHRVAAALEYTS